MQSLLNYTVYSIGQSTMSVKEIVSFAKQSGMRNVALTDYHTLTAAPEFIKECRAAGLKGIVGVTLNVKDMAGSCGHIVLLARDEVGLTQIRSMLDEVGHTFMSNVYNPQQGIDRNVFLTEEWHKKTDHCVLLDGFPGSFAEQEVARMPKEDRTLKGVKLALSTEGSALHQLTKLRALGMYQAVYTPGGKNALAMACASLESEMPTIMPVVNSLMNFASNDIQLVASQHLFRVYAEKWMVNFPSTEAANQWVIDRYRGKSLPSPKTIPSGMASALPDDDVEALFSDVDAGFSPSLKVEKLPFKVMPEISLVELVERKWQERKYLLPQERIEEYKSQLDYELAIIQKMGFENYFLNIYQFKCLADQTDNMIMLRGSAVSSLTMFVLDLMEIDPIKEDLLFARFLSEDRQEEPDVDIEFDDQKRFLSDLVRTFGKDHVANLTSLSGINKARILFTQARNAMVDLYGLTGERAAEVEKAYNKLVSPLMASKSRRVRDVDLDDWLQNDGVQILAKNKHDPALTHIIELAKALNRGYTRPGNTAPSIVVSPSGLKQHFNIIGGDDDNIGVIPVGKINVPSTGFIKYDILSNKIFKRLVMGMKSAGVSPRLEVPDDDRSIFYVFKQRAFLGITQMNGWTAENLSKTVQPANLTEIKAMFALMRTAGTSADSESVNKYNQGRKTPDRLGLPEPMLKSLKETYGVMLYEEQLLVLLTKVAHFSGAEADRFRSALKKGKAEIIDEFEPRFIEQVSRHHGVSPEEASKWYQPFRDKRGRFVFSKAHALAYAKLAVQQCWFKTYYPAHYAAEIYADNSMKVKDKKLPLSAILSDWKLMMDGGWPQSENAKTFLNAIGKVAIRESETPSDGYDFKLRSADVEISEAIQSGAFDPFLGANESRDGLIQHWQKVLQRLDALMVKGSPKRATQPSVRSGAPSGNPGKAPFSSSGSFVPNVASPGEGDDVKTLNQLMKEGDSEPWLDRIMFAQLLPYLDARGVITITDRENKAKKFDHFKFHFNTAAKEGYHLCVPPDDPERLDQSRKEFMTSGIFQGAISGAREKKGTSVKFFFKEMVERGCFQGLERDKPFDYYHSAFREWVLTSETPLYGTHYLVPKSGLTSPLFVPMPIIPQDKLKIAQDSAKDCLENGRRLAPETISRYFEAGALCYRARLDNNLMVSKFKPGQMYRKDYFGVVANFMKVVPNVPLFNNPEVKLGHLSDGGHQTIYRDTKKDDKIARPDLGTNAVYGHYFGVVKPGSETLWVGEGIFDAMAFNELQEWLPSLAPDRRVAEPNCISLKSTQGVKDFFESLLGVKFIVKDGQPIDFQFSEEAYRAEPVNEESVVLYAKYLASHQTVFLHDRTAESERAFNVIRGLYETAGMRSALDDKSRVKVMFCQENQWVSRLQGAMKSDGNKENVDIFHKGNVDQFMRSNNIMLVDNDGQPVVMKAVREKRPLSKPFSEMSATEKNDAVDVLNKRFQFMTGARSLGIALDNDKAGIMEATHLTQFCEMIGLPCIKHMPAIMKLRLRPTDKEDTVIKDHNDYLKILKTLFNENRHDELHQVIDRYTEDFQRSPKLFIEPEPGPGMHQEIQHALKRK